MTFMREFFLFLREQKKLWLLPMLFVLLVLFALIVFTENTALSPFVYTLF